MQITLNRRVGGKGLSKQTYMLFPWLMTHFELNHCLCTSACVYRYLCMGAKWMSTIKQVSDSSWQRTNRTVYLLLQRYLFTSWFSPGQLFQIMTNWVFVCACPAVTPLPGTQWISLCAFPWPFTKVNYGVHEIWRLGLRSTPSSSQLCKPLLLHLTPEPAVDSLWPTNNPFSCLEGPAGQSTGQEHIEPFPHPTAQSRVGWAQINPLPSHLYPQLLWGSSLFLSFPLSSPQNPLNHRASPPLSSSPAFCIHPCFPPLRIK